MFKLEELLSLKNIKRIKKEVIARNGYKCKICSSNKKLHAHHVISSLRGEGQDTLNNLITLCKNCHAKWHGFTHKNGVDKITLDRFATTINIQPGLSIFLNQIVDVPVVKVVAQAAKEKPII